MLQTGRGHRRPELPYLMITSLVLCTSLLLPAVIR